MSERAREREREREREKENRALSGTAKLSDLKSNKKSCKGSLQPNDEKFALAFAFSRERARGKKEGW